MIKSCTAAFFFMLLEFELTLELFAHSAVPLRTTSVALAVEPANTKRIVVALSLHGRSPSSLLSGVSPATLIEEVWLSHRLLHRASIGLHLLESVLQLAHHHIGVAKLFAQGPILFLESLTLSLL